jgi:DNA mismatch repair protein MutS
MTDWHRLGAEPPETLPGAGESETYHGPGFGSIVWPLGTEGVEQSTEPDCFGDLNLDQFMDEMLNSRADHDLAPLFYTTTREEKVLGYRLDAVDDLQRLSLRRVVDTFTGSMEVVSRRRVHAGSMRYRNQRQRWIVESLADYCDAVNDLAQGIAGASPVSGAFQGLLAFLESYVTSPEFVTMAAESHGLREELSRVRYAVQIRGDRVTVRPYDGGDDYSLEVEKTFTKFRQGEVQEYRVDYSAFTGMSHIEAQVLELVGRIHPKLFSRLDEFSRRFQDALDETVLRFDREVQFYLAYLDMIRPLEEAGLEFCRPRLSASVKESEVVAGFDLPLASRLIPMGRAVVPNNFRLTAGERAIVVTGPNQGGKTTFARMFGQLHYLASLGLPVPARQARLFVPDRVFTHFEREEDLDTLRGKLEDELLRLHKVLGEATSDSIVVVNEGFTSTTLADAIFLGTKVMQQMLALDLVCLFVTFVDELASMSDTTVSMVALVDPDDPAVRTHKVVRKPAEGLAYAEAIARKYGLTYRQIKERLGR